LICLKPAFSSLSLADLTAWKAELVNSNTCRSYVGSIRVGEAFTKERKSSAAARDGLVAMVRARDSANIVGMKARVRAGGLGCSRVWCSDVAMGMGLGRAVLKRVVAVWGNAERPSQGSEHSSRRRAETGRCM
jgi:hypothetical protein